MYKKLSLLLLISGIIVFSCKKATIPVYDANSSIYFHPKADSIWLWYTGSDSHLHSQSVPYAKTSQQLDTIIGNLGLIDAASEEVTMESLVWATGQPASHDRAFKVVADTKTSTLPEGDYSIDPNSCVVKAGANTAHLRIRAKKSAAMAKQPLYLTVTLAGGEGLDTAYSKEYIQYQSGVYKSTVTRTFGFYNNLPQPIWWASFGIYYLGEFSTTKLLLLSSHFNLPMATLQDQNFNSSLIMEYGRLLKCYLRSMSDKGTPVMDKNDYTDAAFPMTSGQYASNVCDN